MEGHLKLRLFRIILSKVHKIIVKLPSGHEMYGTKSSLERNNFPVRRNIEPLATELLDLPGRLNLDHLSRDHIIHIEVGVELGPGNNLVPVHGKFGRFDGKIFEVNRLNLGVEFTVNLKD